MCLEWLTPHVSRFSCVNRSIFINLGQKKMGVKRGIKTDGIHETRDRRGKAAWSSHEKKARCPHVINLSKNREIDGSNTVHMAFTTNQNEF